MLNRLVELSLRYKFLVLIVFGVIAFLGAQAVRNVPIDAFPDVTPAQVNIYTESPGLAAEDVEQLLTFPVESAMAGLPKVQEIRSVSLFGLSYVAVYFEGWNALEEQQGKNRDEAKCLSTLQQRGKRGRPTSRRRVGISYGVANFHKFRIKGNDYLHGT